mgnify:CR=1 FL=1
MSADLKHPSQEQLRSFVKNRLDQADMALIRNHLRMCVDCQQFLQNANTDSDPSSETHNALADASHVSTQPIIPVGDKADLAELPLVLANHSRFNVISMLGSGAMGAVYRAVDNSTGKYVAIKVLQAADLQSFRRFQREMELLKRLNHPNLVELYDANLAGETPYLVMECVEGISLDRLLLRRGLLRVADACEVIRQVAQGLVHAHEQNVIHRDIKPSNIMITPQGKVKLLDWGLARILQGNSSADIFITVANQTVGTPDYIAPEQLEDSRTVDARADIYSLGGTLFTLLTGKPPRDWRTGNTVAYQWLQRPDLSVSAIRGDTRSSLRKLLLRMLELNREKRLTSAKQLLEQIEAFCRDADLESLVNEQKAYHPDEGPRSDWIRIILLLIIAVLISASLIIAWFKQG